MSPSLEQQDPVQQNVGVEGAVYDPELFRREILPRLAGVKLSEIVAAAGCSKASASDIKRGKWTPHVSTWGALADVCETKLCELA
jgi:hypothetical protein